MTKYLYPFIVLLQLAPTLTRAQTQLFVKTAGTGDGSSWENATTLANAITTANASTVSTVSIYIASGTYNTPSTLGINSFILTRGGIQLYGGFPSNLTGTTTSGGGDTTTNTVTLQGSSSPHVMTIIGGSTNTNDIILNGLKITGGTETWPPSSPSINNVVVDTHSGAGIYIDGTSSKITIQNCSITYNNITSGESTVVGGGICAKNLQNLEVITSSIYNNKASKGGGGVYLDNTGTTGATLTINQSNITGNNGGNGVGGAICVFNTDVTISNNSILNNNTALQGGAIYDSCTVLNAKRIVISNSKINSNKATSDKIAGGSLFLIKSSAQITDSDISSNTASTNGSNAASICQYAGILRIKNSTLNNNTMTLNAGAKKGGGAIYITSKISPYAAVSSTSASAGTELEIDNCSFQGNISTLGGAILLNDVSDSLPGLSAAKGRFAIRNCAFTSNTSYQEGGALRNNSWTGLFENCTYKGNTSGMSGGAMCLNSPFNDTIVNCLFSGNFIHLTYNDAGTASGFAVHKHQMGNLYILNSTFSGNSGTSENNDPRGTLGIVDANNYIYNCIFYNNYNEGVNSIHNMGTSSMPTTIIVDKCLIAGVASNSTTNGMNTTYTNIINNNPFFTTPITWNNSSANPAGDFTLQSSSPAIDAGNNSYINTDLYPADLAGNARIAGTAVDLGTYEYGSKALPVVLTSFSATVVNKSVSLQWQTASEINNAYFEVQRSADARNFDILGQVNGNGTTNTAHDYSYTDYSPLAGTTFYRLKQVDLDGKSDYSDIRSVSLSSSDVDGIVLAPNPVKAGNVITLKLKKAASVSSYAVIYDLSGTILRQHMLPAGAVSLDIELPHLPSGIYFLRYQHSTIKFVVE